MSTLLRRYHLVRILLILSFIVIISLGWYLTIQDAYIASLAGVSRKGLRRNYINVNSSMKPKLILNKAAQAGVNKSSKFTLNTPGCKIPAFDPWDESVLDLFEPQYEEFDCRGKHVFLKAQPNGSITVDEADLMLHYNRTSKDLKCVYTSVGRISQIETGIPREEDFILRSPQILVFGKPIPEDYVGVFCNVYNDRENLFEHYFPLVHLKNRTGLLEKKNSQDQKLNIILVGIDSISKLNFIRHFNKTHKFIRENLSSFEMRGYTKVGDNTFPNLVPLLTGQFVDKYYSESKENITYFDHLDFIWKNYAKQGYRTFYAEDYPSAGTFNFNKRGFRDPPTDYYYRPLGLAVGFARTRFGNTNKCLNSETDSKMIYDYLKLFLTVMDEKPAFAFTMVSTMTHDYLNYAGYEDSTTANLLRDLSDRGFLNKSMLVLFSDHGIRYGEIRERYIGKFEERMPFMFINFPDWFLKLHPTIAKNLRKNEDRLMTLFDIHATMIHLLNLNRTRVPSRKVTLGTSLLTEIRPERTCSRAHIKAHFCPCQSFRKTSTSSETVKLSAQAIVDYMNEELSIHKNVCAHLEVDEIKDARKGTVNVNLLRYQYWEYPNDDESKVFLKKGKILPLTEFMVTLTAKPGRGVFEGTVRYNSVNETYTLLGVSRINMYGNQSICISSPKLKLYCYCTQERNKDIQ